MLPKQVGRYRILRAIGRGGMGLVYLAEDSLIGRQVVVKTLPTEMADNERFRARFEREARTVAALEHVAIVPIYDYGEENGQLFIVMRYMAGGNLSSVLNTQPLPFQSGLRLLRRIGPALDYAHRQGVIHRDIKPDNILYDQDDNPFLADFGIAKLNEATTQLTQGVIGTPVYMSPEQFEMDSELTPQSDIYSLAALLYRMLTGKILFPKARDAIQMAVAHKTATPTPVNDLNPQLSDDVQAIFEKALAKEPADRYSTAQDMLEGFQAIASGVSAPASIRGASLQPDIDPLISVDAPTIEDTDTLPPDSRDTVLSESAEKEIQESIEKTASGEMRIVEDKPEELEVASPEQTDLADSAEVPPTGTLVDLSQQVNDEPEMADGPPAIEATAPLPAEEVAQAPHPTETLNPPPSVARPEVTADWVEPETASKPEPQERAKPLPTKKAQSGDRPRWILPVALIGVIGCMVLAVLGGGLLAQPGTEHPSPTATEVEIAEATLAPTEPAEAPTATYTIEPTEAEPLVVAETASPTARILPTLIFDRSGAQMGLVRQGEFEMGVQGDGGSLAAHIVFLEDFYIDLFEVTNAQFAEFLNEQPGWEDASPTWMGADPLTALEVNADETWVAAEEFGEKPVHSLTWYGAQAFCEWRDTRLPTEAEWEKAARGALSGPFPWGIGDPLCTAGAINGAMYDGCSQEAAIAVGSYGANSLGLFDLAGNLAEWTYDWFDESYYASSPAENPTGPADGQFKILRGGSWHEGVDNLVIFNRVSQDPLTTGDTIGFRCAASLGEDFPPEPGQFPTKTPTATPEATATNTPRPATAVPTQAPTKEKATDKAPTDEPTPTLAPP
jgi:serine/threonine protein kinase/formylglycine-generating enzyme required for sulfatase activity